MGKLKMWKADWDAAENEWDQKAKEAAQKKPIKSLKVLPEMPGITEETAKYLKWEEFILDVD